MALEFVLPITPVGQMRARSCVRGRHAGTYKAPKQEQQEQTLAALMLPYRPKEPLEGPLLLYVNAVFPIPKSKPKKWRTEALCGRIRPTTKPDADNVAKHLKDVLTQMGFWGDDRQVVDLVVRKWYGLTGKWIVRIESAECWPLGVVGAEGWQDDEA